MHDDKSIELTIETTRGTKVLSFEKTAKVADVIAAAVREFGFSSGDRFELVLKSDTAEPLRPERTLVSYHLTDGTTVVLTAIGAGV